MLSMDTENPDNGFYAGTKMAASFYNQEYKKFPFVVLVAVTNILFFPSVNQSAYWLEGFAGARVQLFKSNLYVDVNAQRRFLLYSTKQEEMKPMIVPGFGLKVLLKFNVGFSWNLAYQF